MRLGTILIFALLAAAPSALPAQDPTSTPAPAPAEPTPAMSSPMPHRPVSAAQQSRTQALSFLTRVEEKNAETKTLQADFTQVRVNTTFMEEVKSEGTFWYSSPSRFYAKYKSENDSEIWMTEDKYIEHIPALRQVDIIPLRQGDDAPMNQMLLGFGVKVDEIRKLFNVSLGEQLAAGTTTINFESKNLDRTMNFKAIAITFDDETVLPRRIVLEDVQGDLTTLEFKGIKLNPELRANVFEIPKWGRRVTVTEHQ